MRMLPILAALLPLAAVPLTACASDPEAIARADAADAARVPAATPVGEAVRCIQTSSIRQSHVRSDRVIDFEMINGRTYRNVLAARCSGLGFEERFAYKSTINQLCSVDTITVLRSGGGVQGPTCGLGEFQPVEIAGPDRG